ncbi:uncharacterized protein ACHE_70204A [Aspergillus chevalieri]|uniref:Uncharacterized protein n=1 Tax=Aspergillus chevalieri TaxID=182096 RepID=A0A7R7VV58_ASPCH|nr:uncharacterized protein ACHE_70204A [Aspergillus chevalieri]BCR91361.1 hypothetical protein ACHE_70204A [Aspergillus chevalieri]
MPTGIGRVLLSSGYTMWNNRVADWAFVQMFDNVTPQPFTFPKIPSSQNPSKFKLGLNYNEGAPLAGFGDLKANEWYCKVGKPTGLIGGICKGVQVPCCWNAVEEYAIVDQVGDYTQTDLCKPGDSDSVLLDRRGRIRDLLYRFTYTYAGIDLNVYAGLAITMSDGKETIKIES